MLVNSDLDPVLLHRDKVKYDNYQDKIIKQTIISTTADNGKRKEGMEGKYRNEMNQSKQGRNELNQRKEGS